MSWASPALQGEWKCVAGEENGKAQDRSAVKRENRRLTIKGNSLTMERVGASWVGKFEIDAINGDFDWVGKGPQEKLVEWIGIYELDDDNLKLCFIFQKDGKAKRPKAFRALPPVPGMPQAFYTFKRDND
ncbi:TIGR03067 domain-containing protein [Schlesneria sp. T3-172]|uniref:TIGR03067 domain-containing protein n=1 Tax=Schlesneria sphaerica TaxID=3373610 RepID=UPI0037C5A6B5